MPRRFPRVSTMSRREARHPVGDVHDLGVGPQRAAAVFVGTVTDKSFRSPEEIRQRLGVPLLAVVPESRRSERIRHGDGDGTRAQG